VNWQAVEDGLRGWVIAMTGTEAHLVAWDKEPVDFRTYNQIDLRLFDHRARNGMEATIVYPEPDEAGLIHPMVVGERACSWSITVTTRDQHANAKAYVVLDSLALMLELPYTQALLEALGMTMIDSRPVIVSGNPPSEHRNLSQAMLRVELGYVLTVSAPAGVVDGVSIIEHAEVSGTVTNVTEDIVIPPTMMPPLPVPTP